MIFSFSDKVLRKKWKYLRDQFAVEVGKTPPPRSGDPGGRPESKWPYFKSLMFLLGIIKPRTSSGNLTSNNRTEQQDEDIEPMASDSNETEPTRDVQEIESQVTHIQEGPQQTQQVDPTYTNFPSSETYSRKRKRTDGNTKYNQQMIYIEEKKASLLERVINERGCNNNNDDALFFQSLLPHVSKIPEHLKLRFRNRVQSLVEEFLYGSDSSSMQSSHLNRQQKESLHPYSPEYMPFPGSSHTTDSSNSSTTRASSAQPQNSAIYEELRSYSNETVW